MTPWTEYTQENVNLVPDEIIGVFQLAHEEGKIAFVGGTYTDLRQSLNTYLGKGYTHFQWVKLPWTREVFEMSCRLYHFGGGGRSLDNIDHPYPPEGKFWSCPVSTKSAATCEL